MRPLELNLASRPFRNNGLLWIGHGLLALAVIAFTAWNTVTFVETGRELDELRNTVGSVDSRLREVEARERGAETRIAKHDLKYLNTQTLRANEVIQRRAFSWTRLFNLLEDKQPYEIKMVSIHPVFGTGTGVDPASGGASKPEVVPVSVEGTAKTIRDFFELEDALIADPHFDRIEPSRISHAKNGEVLFGLSFLYFPDGLKEKGESAVADADVPVEEAGDEAGGSIPPARDEEVAQDQPPPQQPSAPGPPVAVTGPGGSAAKEEPPRATEATEIAPPRPAFREPQRRPPPEGPIRKKPDGWQPPDPFADRKKEDGR